MLKLKKVMKCQRCDLFFVLNTCDKCWRVYWLRVTRLAREDGSRSYPGIQYLCTPSPSAFMHLYGSKEGFCLHPTIRV